MNGNCEDFIGKQDQEGAVPQRLYQRILLDSLQLLEQSSEDIHVGVVKLVLTMFTKIQGIQGSHLTQIISSVVSLYGTTKSEKTIHSLKHVIQQIIGLTFKRMNENTSLNSLDLRVLKNKMG